MAEPATVNRVVESSNLSLPAIFYPAATRGNIFQGHSLIGEATC